MKLMRLALVGLSLLSCIPLASAQEQEEDVAFNLKVDVQMADISTAVDVLNEIVNSISNWVNFTDSAGNTMLILAAQRGCNDIAGLLINAGADINAQNKTGETALNWAVYKDNVPLIEFLITRGADVNLGDVEGCTPLHWAVHRNNLAAAALLLEGNAQPDVSNDAGETPLFHAYELSKKYQEMVYLLERAIENTASDQINDETGISVDVEKNE